MENQLITPLLLKDKSEQMLSLSLADAIAPSNFQPTGSMTIKQALVPMSWKANLDYIMREELMGANRYFAATNPKLAHALQYEASKSPAHFLHDLNTRWEWHNEFFEDILEPALLQLLEKNPMSLTLRQLDSLTEAYKTTSLVDQATLIISGAIKKHLDAHESQFSHMSERERFLLRTPPTPSFYLEYHQDHLQLILLEKSDLGAAKSWRTNLLKKYHVDDATIMNGRMRIFEEYRELPIDKLNAQIIELSESKVSFTEQLYFLLDNPAARPIAKIYQHDNYDEYRMITSLTGVSGFILRKTVLNYLGQTKLLPQANGIYDSADIEVVDALAKLRNYRQEVSFKELRPLLQSTPVTCAAACLAMISHYWNGSELTSELESSIYGKTKASLMDGSHMSAVAYYARSELGLEGILIHSEQELFKNDLNYVPSALFKPLLTEYRNYLESAILSGIGVQNGTQIDSSALKQLLQNDYLILLSGMTGGVLHVVLIEGYNHHGFVVIDPLCGRTVWSKERVESFSNTPIGQWLLALRQDSTCTERLNRENIRFRKDAEILLSRAGACQEGA